MKASQARWRGASVAARWLPGRFVRVRARQNQWIDGRTGERIGGQGHCEIGDDRQLYSSFCASAMNWADACGQPVGRNDERATSNCFIFCCVLDDRRRR